MEALARDRQPPATGLIAALWGGGLVLAVVFGVAAATSITAVVGLLGVLTASAVVAAAFTETRWALIVLLFLLYSYAGWVVGHAVGLPEISQPLLLLIIAALAWRHLPRNEELSLPAGLPAILILGLALAASAAFTTDLDASLRQLWDFFGYGLTVVAIVALLDRPVWLRRAVWAVVVGGGALAVISLIQVATGAYASDFGGFAIARPEGAGVFRVGGPLDPNFFGQVLVATAVLAIYLALSTRDRVQRGVALAMFAACIAATGFTGSRGTLVAAAAAFGLILLLAPIRRGLVAAIVALFVTAGLVFLPSGLQARVGLPGSSSDSPEVVKVTQGSEGAIRGRQSEALAALRMFRDHPILGVGPGNYPQHYLGYSQEIGLDSRLATREAHSLYLGALAETGIVGTAALLAVLWLALRGAWRGRRWLRGNDGLLAEGIFVALVSFLVAGLFLHAAYPRYLWILVAFAFVAGQLAHNAARQRGFEMQRAQGVTAGRPAPSMAPPRPPASKPSAEPPHSDRRGHRRGRGPIVTGAMLIAATACVGIILVLIGGGDGNPMDDTSRELPTAGLTPGESAAPAAHTPPAAPTAQTPSAAPAAPTPSAAPQAQTPPAPAQPAGMPAARTAHCGPIVGSGVANTGMRYPVTSYAPDGKPAGCDGARSVLLSALNGGETTVGAWSCATNPAGPTVATCTSGARRIQARVAGAPAEGN